VKTERYSLQPFCLPLYSVLNKMMSGDNIPFRSSMIIPKDRTRHRTTFMAIINYANPRDMV